MKKIALILMAILFFAACDNSTENPNPDQPQQPVQPVDPPLIGAEAARQSTNEYRGSWDSPGFVYMLELHDETFSVYFYGGSELRLAGTITNIDLVNKTFTQTYTVYSEGFDPSTNERVWYPINTDILNQNGFKETITWDYVLGNYVNDKPTKIELTDKSDPTKVINYEVSLI